MELNLYNLLFVVLFVTSCTVEEQQVEISIEESSILNKRYNTISIVDIDCMKFSSLDPIVNILPYGNPITFEFSWNYHSTVLIHDCEEVEYRIEFFNDI